METENPFTSGQTLWHQFDKYIQNTARSISHSYAKVEEEDVLQEIWLFLWKTEKHFLEQERSDEYIKTSIKNVARNYALKVRDTTLFETDRFYYSYEELKTLLPYLFSLYESWNMTQSVNNGTESYDSRDTLAMMCDFSIALDSLNDSMRSILIRKYGEGEELSEQNDRQQASRALKKLWLTLNAETDKRAKTHTGPGNRQAITNANGSYQTKSDYYE